MLVCVPCLHKLMSQPFFSATLQKKFTWHLQLLASICGNNQILESLKVINRLRPQMSNVRNNSLQYTSVYSHVLEIDGSNILKIHHTWPVLWRLGSPKNGGIEGFHLKSTLEKHVKPLQGFAHEVVFDNLSNISDICFTSFWRVKLCFYTFVIDVASSDVYIYIVAWSCIRSTRKVIMT